MLYFVSLIRAKTEQETGMPRRKKEAPCNNTGSLLIGVGMFSFS